MIQTAVKAGNDQHISFFNLFVSSEKNNADSDIIELYSTEAKIKNPLRVWFEMSSLLIPIEFTSIPAGKIFGTDRITVRFKLSNDYRNRFVLLCGLLEFSRPKDISISANALEKTFELHLGENQIGLVIAFLDTILHLLLKEIAFKNSLKAVLRFEHAVKVEQAKLYEALQASVH